MRYTFHDFRRLFITEAIVHGMPPHIAQLVAGHRDINITMGYKAVYPEEVDQRLTAHSSPAVAPCVPPRNTAPRPTMNGPSSSGTSSTERSPSAPAVARTTPPASTNTLCPLPIAMAGPRRPAAPQQIRDNLLARIAEAEAHRWHGEVEGLQVSLAGAHAKLAQMDRRTATTTELGIPSLPTKS